MTIARNGPMLRHARALYACRGSRPPEGHLPRFSQKKERQCKRREEKVTLRQAEIAVLNALRGKYAFERPAPKKLTWAWLKIKVASLVVWGRYHIARFQQRRYS
jgi:hypothetical protein